MFGILIVRCRACNYLLPLLSLLWKSFAYSGQYVPICSVTENRPKAHGIRGTFCVLCILFPLDSECGKAFEGHEICPSRFGEGGKWILAAVIIGPVWIHFDMLSLHLPVKRACKRPCPMSPVSLRNTFALSHSGEFILKRFKEQLSFDMASGSVAGRRRAANKRWAIQRRCHEREMCRLQCKKCIPSFLHLPSPPLTSNRRIRKNTQEKLASSIECGVHIPAKYGKDGTSKLAAINYHFNWKGDVVLMP